MSLVKRVANNAALSGLATTWKVLISFVLTPFLIHSLGSSAYGIWVLMLSFSVYGYLSLFSLGLQGALVKHVAEYRARNELENTSEVFRAGLLFLSAVGVLAFIVLLVFASLLLERVFHIPSSYVAVSRTLLGIVAAQALFDFPGLAFAGVIEGVQRYDILALLELARSTLFAGAAIISVSNGYGMLSLGIIVLGLSILNTALMALVALRLVPSLCLFGRISYQNCLPTVRLSGKLFLLRLNAVIYSQMDKAILAAMITTTVLSNYDVVARFHSLASLTMGLLSSVLMPTSAALYAAEDSTRLKALFLTGTKYSAALAVPLSLILMILARPLIYFWVGEEYVADSSLVRVALAYTLFWVLVQVGWNIMIGMDKTGAILRIQLATTGVNLFLSIVMTSYMGIVGVFLGTLIGNAAAAMCYMCLFLKALGVNATEFVREVIMKVYPQAAVSAIGLQLILLLRPPGSLVEAVLYGGLGMAAAILLFAISGISHEERRQLGGLCRQWKESVIHR